MPNHARIGLISDTGAKQMHGRGMAHGMRADMFVAQRRRGFGGLVRGAHDESMNAIASDRAAVDIEDDRCLPRAVDSRSEQLAKHLGGTRPEGTSPDLASLSVEAHEPDVGSQWMELSGVTPSMRSFA